MKIFAVSPYFQRWHWVLTVWHPCWGKQYSLQYTDELHWQHSGKKKKWKCKMKLSSKQYSEAQVAVPCVFSHCRHWHIAFILSPLCALGQALHKPELSRPAEVRLYNTLCSICKGHESGFDATLKYWLMCTINHKYHVNKTCSCLLSPHWPFPPPAPISLPLN